MTVKLSTGLRNGMLGSTGFAELFANGVIEIRSGPQPITADAAATGTLLGLVTKDGLAWVAGSPTNGLNFNAPANGAVSKNADNWRFNGLANGTAGWFRLKGNAADDGSVSTTLPRLDGSIGVGSGDMPMSRTDVQVGVPSTIDVFSFMLPAQ